LDFISRPYVYLEIKCIHCPS